MTVVPDPGGPSAGDGSSAEGSSRTGGSGVAISGSNGTPVMSRVLRPCVMKVHAQRVTTTIRFANPIRYTMWIPSHSSQAVNPPRPSERPQPADVGHAGQAPDDGDVAAVAELERLDGPAEDAPAG